MIYFSEVQCTGAESRLVDCIYKKLNLSGNCSHDNDAGIKCSNGELLYSTR